MQEGCKGEDGKFGMRLLLRWSIELFGDVGSYCAFDIWRKQFGMRSETEVGRSQETEIKLSSLLECDAVSLGVCFLAPPYRCTESHSQYHHVTPQHTAD